MATRKLISRRIRERVAAAAAPFLSYTRERAPSRLTTAVIIILGAFFLIGFLRHRHGTIENRRALKLFEADFSCNSEVERAIPILKKAYPNSMHKVLHVGPDSCSIVSRLLTENGTEALGVDPYKVENATLACKRMVRRGLVRVFDIKYPLPYRAKSFPLVIVSDSLDYLTPKYLNSTIPELARVSSDGLVIFSGFIRHQKSRTVDRARFGRPAKMRTMSWWVRQFVELNLEENEDAYKKFEKAAARRKFVPNCQIFHLKPYDDE